jgi:O-antigen ligase
VRRIAVVPAAAAGSLAAGAATVVAPTAVAAALSLGALIAAPEVVFSGLVVALEEQLNAGGVAAQVDPAVAFGSQLYTAQVVGLSLAMLLAIAAAFTATLRARFRVTCDRPVLLVAGALAGWSTALAWLQGEPLQDAVTSSTPWVLFAVALVLGDRIFRSARKRVTIAAVVGGLIVAKAAVAAATVAGTMGTAAVGRAFYDSATPAVAMAVLIAATVSSSWRSRSGAVAILGSALVVGLSFRRNIWLSGAVVAVWLPLLFRNVRALFRPALVFALAALITAVVAPNVASAVKSSATSATATLSGSGRDDSVRGHIADLHTGWELAANRPLLGIGVRSLQQPGLAADDSRRLYVHNELLQTWLRLGIFGLVCVLALVALTVRRAATVFRIAALRSDVVAASAALFVLMLPVTLMFFPHLSTTVRWPVLSGLAAGIVGAAVRLKNEEEAPV